VVKDWIAKAVKPLLRLAKHIFRPVAEPMVELTCFMLRTSASFEPLGVASERL
jgi:hypothetical protein